VCETEELTRVGVQVAVADLLERDGEVRLLLLLGADRDRSRSAVAVPCRVGPRVSTLLRELCEHSAATESAVPSPLSVQAALPARREDGRPLLLPSALSIFAA
jgi:hypothetical protein